MLLTKVRIKKFRSIDDSTEVSIEKDITVLVGQNESGKTAFLEALSKALSSENNRYFSVMEDYPRRHLSEYQRRHDREPQPVLDLTYSFSDKELLEIDELIGLKVKVSSTFSVVYNYANQSFNNFTIDEEAFVIEFLERHEYSDSLKKLLEGSKTIRDALYRLQSDTTDEACRLSNEWFTRFQPNMTGWINLLTYEVWSKLVNRWQPKFYYFDDYYLLPGKINLQELIQNRNSRDLAPNMKTALSLLTMAGVSLEELNSPNGYEEIKAKLEGISNSITDNIFRYWQQNKDLQVEFDIRTDPKDLPPFNTGPNLYVRIRNTRHRVSVPFNQRSKGFIWFFSFIVWFDTIQEKDTVPPILLLDEPGLSLHALAQGDLLTYIDQLCREHQVIYSTHSPFMIKSDSLHRCRLVEDRHDLGTIVSEAVAESNKRTLFPLQAVMGYAMAENLFIGKKNLLVKSAAELLYLKYFSAQLEQAGKKGLREDILVIPMGGLDKAVTFIALANTTRMDIVILHDGVAQSESKIESAVKQKSIVNYGSVLDPSHASKKEKKASTRLADLEDLISPELYLKQLQGAYGKKFAKLTKESDLPAKEKLLTRVEAYLEANEIELKPAFNSYLPAMWLAANPQPADTATLDRFEALFNRINSLL